MIEAGGIDCIERMLLVLGLLFMCMDGYVEELDLVYGLGLLQEVYRTGTRTM